MTCGWAAEDRRTKDAAGCKECAGTHSLKGDACAHGWLGEDHGHGEPSKGLVALIPVFQLLLHL